ncbi:MAG: NYN domain-containing protein, partial [Gemmataceae bacterium]
MSAMDGRLTRIGIFYDGNFFFHVSNYYHYHHERRARVSISGLHAFVRQQVADCEKTDPRYCQIVDAHYFRGRLRAADAEDRDLLYKERVFDDVLVREGVTTHYLPLTREGEKGIDVWLALEAYELAIYKRFDVVVLVVCDGDFLPLVRKLNTLGTRVMVLGWDFHFVDPNGNDRETRTAQVLLDEVTYPIMMHPIIEDRARQRDPLLNGLFVPRKEFNIAGPTARSVATVSSPPSPLPRFGGEGGNTSPLSLPGGRGVGGEGGPVING